MKEATLLIHLIKPINDREIDSHFWTYEKVKSVMCGCKTEVQLVTASHWASAVMRYLHPNYPELCGKLSDLFWELHDKIVEQRTLNYEQTQEIQSRRQGVL